MRKGAREQGNGLEANDRYESYLQDTCIRISWDLSAMLSGFFRFCLANVLFGYVVGVLCRHVGVAGLIH